MLVPLVDGLGAVQLVDHKEKPPVGRGNVLHVALSTNQIIDICSKPIIYSCIYCVNYGEPSLLYNRVEGYISQPFGYYYLLK